MADDWHGHTLVCGTTGSGKSFYTRRQLRHRKRVIALDPMQDYGGSGTGFKSLNWDASNPSRSWQRLVSIIKPVWSYGFKVSVRPRRGEGQETLSQLSDYLMQAQAPYKKGLCDGLTMVIEEMNTSYPSESLPGNLRGFEDVIFRGRHVGISAIGVTQTPQKIGGSFRDNVYEWIVFPLGSDLAIDRIRKDLGKQVADAVFGLKLGDHTAIRRVRTNQLGHFTTVKA